MLKRDIMISFLALVSFLLGINLIFSIYRYPENRPIIVASEHSNALVSLLTLAGDEAEHLSMNYVVALCKLAVSFRINGGRDHDLVLLVVDPNNKLKQQQALKEAGWILVYVDGIGSPLIYWYHSNKYSMSQMYSKFQIWRLTSYDHVAYVDSDTIVLKNPMPGLTKAYSVVHGEAPGMVVDLGFCIDTYFNAGMMVVRPSIKVFRDLLFYRNWMKYEPGMAEQEFINNFYRGQIASLPPELNVPAYYYNDSCALVDPSKTVIAHYNGDTKPWLVNCTSHPVCRYWHAMPMV
jgi:hypothetical protein